MFWTDIPSKAASKFNITEETLIKLVEYLIDNIYVNIGNRVYRQWTTEGENGLVSIVYACAKYSVYSADIF